MKIKPKLKDFFALMLFVFLCSYVWADSSSPPADGVLSPAKTSVKPKIDGFLEDEAWQKAPPLEKDFISYSPVFGEKLPYKTLVWMVNDSKNLYFAFRCYDPEPQKIKTSITKRDNIFSDDWIGVSLDSLRTRQTAYDFFVNPHGIQGDKLESAVSGEDLAPDFVWESAGRLTEQGYEVEIRIPLESLGFKKGKQVKMGVLFRRYISRLSLEGAWPEIEPGQSVFNTHAAIVYKGLKKPLKLELLPSITYSNNRERLNLQQWGEKDILTEFGIGLKYGITSSIIADITINPDFSQVESDEFQVEVNQRYPLFFSEKRPFFMEGADIFSFFAAYRGFMVNSVHTRNIVNPQWGIKLTGNIGKAAFGILSAGDELPVETQNNDKNAFFGIARGKYSLGQDNYIGFLYSGREFAGQYNRVLGADMGYRLHKNHKINASYIYSMSGENNSPNDQDVKSSYYSFRYTYITKPLTIDTEVEHIGKDFRIDSGFFLRGGINQWISTVAYNIYPDPGKLPWLKRISPRLTLYYVYDLYQKRNEYYFQTEVAVYFTKRGYFSVRLGITKEGWEADTFKKNFGEIAGRIQLNRRLYISGSFTYGDKLYYGQPAFRGKGYDGSLSLVLQPNKKFNQKFSYVHSDFSTTDGQKLYEVNLLYSRTTYQFNKYFFLRAILQYNSYQKRLLTDFLASFTLIPGTVLHVGYGGIYENREWQGNDWVYRQGDLVNLKRSLFIKASYLWRL